ncbi:MAG: PIN domain-containing protein [Candidatus Bathyarchaeia archaeon]|jgi:predicted nucleic acid-binding protein
MDVVVDTDILSTFAKVNKLKLLVRLFPKSRILVCPSVNLEIKKGAELGLLRYSHPPDFISVKLGMREKAAAGEVREALNLGLGDAECLAVARNRNCLLLTNDRKAERAAGSLSIHYLNLPLLLRELWRSHVMTKSRVAKLIDEIERKDNVVIKNREFVFK